MLRLSSMLAIAVFLLAWLAPSPIASNDCRTRPPFVGYSFISPAIANPNWKGAPLFLDFEALERYYKRRGNPQVVGNVEEWHQRFCEVPLLRDIGMLIYQFTISDLEQLRDAIRRPSATLGYRMEDNSFARYLRRNKCMETVDYLIFAKRCEPFVTKNDAWKDAPNTKLQRMQELIEECKKAFRGTKSHYIRLRYAYQAIRLAHYSKSYQKVLELEQYFLPKTANDESIIDYWIMGHVAGAKLALKDTIEAAYLFSRIFDECPSKRESAYRSFLIKDDDQWRRCLLRCQDDHERATLFAIRANRPNSKLLVEMRNIYNLAPNSPYLNLLLIQEMKRLEKHLLGVSFNDYRRLNERYYGIPSKEAGRRIIELQRFTGQVLDEGLVKDEALWRLCEGYLAFLSGNIYDARIAFDNARKVISPKSFLDEQLQVFELAMQLSSYQEVSDSMENDLAYIRQINDLYEKYTDFPDFTNDKMYQLFRKAGQPGKAFLFHYTLNELKPNPKPDIFNNLILVCLDPARTKLEDQLVARGDSTFINELLDIKATYLMTQYQFEAALETLKQMPRTEWDNFGLFSPFVERINDCVKCGIPSDQQLYNKGQLLERLLDLEYRAKAGIGNSAWNYYQIGLALYNMSYFSYSWKALDYKRNWASIQPENLKDGDNITWEAGLPYGNREHFDCSQARYYFERARLGTDSTNLAAKATFMAAKCEQNGYYVSRWQEGAVQTLDNFELLVQNYSETPMFQLFIDECKYFRAYAVRE